MYCSQMLPADGFATLRKLSGTSDGVGSQSGQAWSKPKHQAYDRRWSLFYVSACPTRVRECQERPAPTRLTEDDVLKQPTQHKQTFLLPAAQLHCTVHNKYRKDSTDGNMIVDGLTTAPCVDGSSDRALRDGSGAACAKAMSGSREKADEASIAREVRIGWTECGVGQGQERHMEGGGLGRRLVPRSLEERTTYHTVAFAVSLATLLHEVKQAAPTSPQRIGLPCMRACQAGRETIKQDIPARGWAR